MHMIKKIRDKTEWEKKKGYIESLKKVNYLYKQLR